MNRKRTSAYIGRFFFAGVIISYFFLVPESLQKVYGFSPLLSALAFMPETIPQFIFGILQSKLSEKIHTSTILVYGITLVFIGIASSFYLGLNHGYILSVSIPMIFVGMGQGLAFGPLTSFGVANTTKEISGVASSVVNVFHQIGSSVILSLIVYMTSTYKLQVISYQQQMLIMTFIMLIPILMSINIKMSDN